MYEGVINDWVDIKLPVNCTLTFGTAPRGACLLRTAFYKPELSGRYQFLLSRSMIFKEFERMKIDDTNLLREQAFINGEWVDADSGETIKVLNPATGDLRSAAA